ncbi:MAG: hypothetical protein JWP29_296 [Rhodoferax sp.]|nr:hypothetical protein [Rhodoferax sp.]
MIRERVIVAFRGRTLVSEIRFSPDGHAGEHPPFFAACNLLFESPTVVWISMLSGEPGRVGRRQLRELAELLVPRGVVTVMAERAEGHRIPRAVQLESGDWAIPAAAFARRVKAST